MQPTGEVGGDQKGAREPTQVHRQRHLREWQRQCWPGRLQQRGARPQDARSVGKTRGSSRAETMVPGSRASKAKVYLGYRYKADSEPDRGRARHVRVLHTTKSPARSAEKVRAGFFNTQQASAIVRR